MMEGAMGWASNTLMPGERRDLRKERWNGRRTSKLMYYSCSRLTIQLPHPISSHPISFRLASATMSESLAVVGSIALFGPDGWFDHVVGWPQGAEVDGSGDTGDSRWPSPLDVADDPQLAEWRRLKELADAEDEWKPNVEGEVASPVRLRQPNGKLKWTGAKTFQFFYPASVLVSLGCLSMSALYWYIVIEAQKTTAKAELSK
jgi:hypothetical protein